MRCEQARRLLEALSDGELSPRAAGQVKAHLGQCDACAHELAAIEWLGVGARAWRDGAAPGSLRGRIANALAAEPVCLVPERSPGMRAREVVGSLGRWVGGRRRVAIGAVVAVVVALLLVVPRGRQGVSLAAVRSAFRQTNTWHLVGWRLLDGRRVPWEIWGRRHPAFYYERRGDQAVLDDGRQRLEVFAAAPRGWREAFALRTPSGQGSRDLGWDFARMVESLPRDTKPFRETPSAVVIRWGIPWMEGADTDPQVLYTIDRRTLLPTVIDTLRRPTPGRPHVLAEHLVARYDEPVPAGVAAPALPAGARLYDTTSVPPDAGLPTENMATVNGLSAQVLPVAMDRRGILLVRVNTWLGGTPLTTRPPVWRQVDVPSWAIGLRADPPTAVGDDGRLYLYVEQIANLLRDGLLVFAPVEPLRPGEAPPRSLTMNLGIACFTVQSMAGVGPTADARRLLAEDLHWDRVALPEPGPPIDLLALRTPGVRLAEELPAAVHLADARCLYYQRLHDPKRALIWRKRSIELCPARTVHGLFLRLELAMDHESVRDRRGALEAYRSLAGACRQATTARLPAVDPAARTYLAQAEAALKRLAGKPAP